MRAYDAPSDPPFPKRAIRIAASTVGKQIIQAGLAQAKLAPAGTFLTGASKLAMMDKALAEKR